MGSKAKVYRLFRGKRMTMCQISFETGLSYSAIRRLARRHPEDLTESVDRLLHLMDRRERVREAGQDPAIFRKRIHLGWTMDEALYVPKGMR